MSLIASYALFVTLAEVKLGERFLVKRRFMVAWSSLVLQDSNVVGSNVAECFLVWSIDSLVCETLSPEYTIYIQNMLMFWPIKHCAHCHSSSKFEGISRFNVKKVKWKGKRPSRRGFICTNHPAARVRFPSTPSTIFSIYNVEIDVRMRKGQK